MGTSGCLTEGRQTRFGWITKKHHCYVCGIVVCKECTSNSSWCTSKSWFSRNRDRRCRNAGGHQNRETECLQRRIKLGSCQEAQWLREMMIAIPHRQLTRNDQYGTHRWKRNYRAHGGWATRPLNA